MPDDVQTLSTDPTTTEAPAIEPAIGDAAQQAILRDLSSERKARKELQSKLAEMQSAEESRVQAAAAERGEFKELYESQTAEFERLKTAHGELAARETTRLEHLTERNAAAIEALPESYRGLIPAGLDPDIIAEQIEKIRGIVQAQPGHPRGGQVGGGTPRGISDEAKEWAAKYRTTPETAQRIIDQRVARQGS